MSNRNDANAQKSTGDGTQWLVGGGEMGKLVRSMDWSKTPLGPMETWPSSLKTTVGLALSSNFPISLAWGPEHIQIYNDGYWPICGAKHPTSMGQNFKECWASAFPVISDAFEKALSGVTSYLENQRMFLDRYNYLEETFFTFSFSPVRDDSGKVVGLFHPVTETTQTMVSERRTRTLRDLAARSGKATTLENAFDTAAHTLTDNNLDIPFFLIYEINPNKKSARLIGKSKDLTSRVAPAETSIENGDEVWPLLSVIEQGGIVQIDDLAARFGEFAVGPYPETPKSALILPISLRAGEYPVGFVIAGVSSRLSLTESYRSFYDLLMSSITSSAANARAYEEETKRAEALAELDRAKTEFFSNVSHEFRTPLTLMIGPLEDELAEVESPLPPARHERLEAAHRNTLRLLKLVNTLLDFSRIEAGRVQATFEPIDLAAYTTELASSFRSAVEKAGLEYVVDCQKLPGEVYVDRDMWEKIVLNLLSNAVKHTFKGSIRVALNSRGDDVELRVQDTGVGIPASEVGRLFERFYRVKGAKSRSHEGSGIGLALVKELAANHGGAVRIESREGVGSVFIVTINSGKAHLPKERIAAGRESLRPSKTASAYSGEAMHWLDDIDSEKPTDLSVEADADSPNSDTRNTTQFTRRPRILWADDNADMREYVRRLLSKNYEVTAVGDGLTALQHATSNAPDLILSDVMMPGLDGFKLIKELRRNEQTRMIPVILLSARAGEEAAIEGLEAGADDYLVKPFAAKELLARVRTHVELSRLRRELSEELELRVHERTIELLQATENLEKEMAERVRIDKKLQAQVERLSLLHQITRATGERQDLQSIFEIVIRTLEDSLPINFGCFAIYDDVAHAISIKCVGTKSLPLALELAMSENAHVPIDENGLSQCVAGNLVYEPDIRDLPFSFPKRLARGGLSSLVASPLIVDGKVFGVLLAARSEPDSFSSGECEFIKQLTEHVSVAAHQVQLYAALQKAYDDLRETQQAALQQERLRALGQMASGIAHDINNAIAPISMYTEILLESEPNLSSDTRNYLEITQRAIEDVAQTVARMREFYRPNEAHLSLVPVNINRLIPQVVDLTRARWSDMPQMRGIVIHVKTELDADLPMIRGIESEIREALTNLIFNAIDAMPSGGTLTIRTHTAQRLTSQKSDASNLIACLEVIDTGVGMDEEAKRRCLEPFFTTKGERGTGLGLAMVYGVTQRHGANVEVESTLGIGTTLRLVFPIPKVQELYSTGESITTAIAPPMRILIIDDDPMVARTLKNVLEADSHIVTMADGGRIGIETFSNAVTSKEPFDLVISDLGMPYIDGRAVAKSIKGLSPTIPFILLTGWGQRLGSDIDQSPHIDFVLGKPPKVRELREVLLRFAPKRPVR